MNVRGFFRAKRSPQRQGQQGAFLILLLLSFLPYANSLAGKFVYNDNLQIVENPYAHSFRYLPRIFGTTVWSFRGAEGVTAAYRPFMSFSYLLIYKIAGLNPPAFHFVSLLLHALAVWLIFSILRRLSGERVAMVSAGLFALHPVHTEAIAWIGGMTELELSLFFLLAFWIYLSFTEASQGLFARAGMCLSFAVTLLSGEQAFFFPILLTIFEHFYRDDRNITTRRQKVSRYAPVWVVAIIYAALRIIVLVRVSLPVPHPNWSATILSAISWAGTSLGKLIWPVHLSAYYGFPSGLNWSSASVLGGLAGIALCGVLFAILWRHVRILSFGILWIFLTLAPALIARWLPDGAFAEQYLYLPSVGFCWIVGWAAVVAWSGEAPMLPRPLSRVVPIGLLIIAMLFGVRTIRRNKDWANDETLYRKTLEAEPNALPIRTRLGALLFNQGDLAGGEREWQEALTMDATDVSALSHLGLLRTAQHHYEDSLRYFDRAIQIQPVNLSANLGLADAYAEMRRVPEAEAHFRTTITLSPLSIKARNDYAQFLFDSGRIDEARNEYEQSIGVDPSAEAYDRLGNIYVKWQDWKRAEDSYGHAISLNPVDSEAYFGLAMLYEADGRPGDALREVERGLAIDPSNADGRALAIRLRGSAPKLPSPIRH